MYRRAGRNFGLSPRAAPHARRVSRRAAADLVGLRIALGIAWLVVVAAEMIAVDSGLGYLVIDSRNAGKRYDLVVAAMLLIGVIGLALDLGFRAARAAASRCAGASAMSLKRRACMLLGLLCCRWIAVITARTLRSTSTGRRC